MKYYKVIKDSEFIGVGISNDLRRYQKKHSIYLSCDEESAQYIDINGNIYHATWMLSPTNVEYVLADVYEIEKDEYDILKGAEESGEEIIVEEPQLEQPEETEEMVDEVNAITIEYVANKKIEEMKKVCNETIKDGFDLVLSDRKTHHFSMSEQDQINLMSANALVVSGQTSIPYHADSEQYKYYDASDISLIVEYANKFKIYHLSYFNSLRKYILSLKSIDSINKITYGFSIPNKYKSNVLMTYN